MNCSQCQKNIEPSSKFCPYCGAMNEEAAATVEAPSQNATQGVSLQDNPYIKQGKELSKLYFGFALQVLKSPYKMTQQVTEKDMINGIISIILMSFFVPLYAYQAASKASRGFLNIPFTDLVMKPLFVQLILLGSIAGSLFLVARLMKVQTSFSAVVAKFGTIITVPAVFFLAANVFLFISVHVFSGILFLLGSLTMSLTIVATVFALKTGHEQGGIDAFYAVFIAFVIIGILFLILGESIISNIGNQMDNIFRIW